MFHAVADRVPKLQRAADSFIEDYGIGRVVVEVSSSKDYRMTTDFKGKILVSLDKFERDIDLFEAICELLFNHLSTCKRWKFGEDPEISFLREKEERVRYAIAILDRCVDLGLLQKK
jgi:hypothetical protein